VFGQGVGRTIGLTHGVLLFVVFPIDVRHTIPRRSEEAAGTLDAFCFTSKIRPGSRLAPHPSSRIAGT
jgi:hypothetical protein